MLKKDEMVKVYHFDYGNKFKCILSWIFSYLLNIAFMCLVLLFIFLIYVKSVSVISIDVIKSVLSFIFLIFSIGVVIFFNIISFKKKRVILCSNNILIRKNTFFKSIYYASKGVFNQIIMYCNIEYCDFCDSEHTLRYWDDYAVEWFNKNSLVLIKDKLGRKYYVPVKNPEEFIEDVNKMIELSGKKNTSD